MSAKFRIPDIRPQAMLRQRLHERLNDAARRPLTLMAAPAGSGKTVLASTWAATGPPAGQITWITLDREDVRPPVFWAYVLQGLRRGGAAIPAEDGAVRPAGIKRSFLIRVAAVVSQQPRPTVLILDNAELLARSPVLSDLDFLLRHAAPQLRLVVLSRVDPALPLYRYRLEGAITEFRLADLAFSVAETNGLLELHGVRLPPPLVAQLAGRSQGWAAGLRLAAMSLRGRPLDQAERIVQGFSGDREDIAEYFLAEVLDAQPPDVRDFLLRTSVVDQLWPALVERLSGRSDAGRVLQALVHSNTFVEPSDVEGRYRYHPLFRDLLRAQLAYEQPAAVPALHRRAARWLADHGEMAAAVEHAAAARDWTGAAELLVDRLALARLLVGPDRDRLLAALDGMPPDAAEPAGRLVLAVAALAGRDWVTAAAHLAAARRGGTGGPAALTTGIELAEMLLAARRGDVPTALDRAARIENALAGGGEPAPAELRALLSYTASRALLWAGDLVNADRAGQAAADAAGAPGHDQLRLHLLGYLALVNALWGRLRRAQVLGHEVLAAADQHGLPVERAFPVACVALAWTYTDEYEIAAARRQVRQVAAASIRDDPVAVGALLLVRARLLRTRGEYVPAAAVLRQARQQAGALPRWFEELIAVSQDGTASGAGPPGLLATPSPGPPLPVPRETAPLEVRVSDHLHQTGRELEAGRYDAARCALEQALRLAKPENLRRPIIEAPPRVRGLLRNSPDLADRHRWLGPTAAGGGAGRGRDAADAPIVVDALTEKEQEVLVNMAELLSTEEIARTMFVSVNTIKTHVRKILRKLAVSRRNEAIRRAKDLGLLPGEGGTPGDEDDGPPKLARGG